MWRFGNITLCIALILAGHRDPNESAFVWLQEKAAPDTYPSSTNRTCHLPPHPQTAPVTYPLITNRTCHLPPHPQTAPFLQIYRLCCRGW